MSRPVSRWHTQRLRKAQLMPPSNGEATSTERSNEHNDSNYAFDVDDIDDTLPGAYAISKDPFSESQIPSLDSNEINTTTIDQLLHNEISSNNENVLQNNDDIPNWSDLNQDYKIIQPSHNHGSRTNKQILCASLSIFVVLSIIAIVPTIVITQMSTQKHDEAVSFCKLEKKEMVQCQYDFLEVPSCANATFQQLAMDLLDGNHSHPYPCDSRHFALVAVAVAQVNEEDPIDDILEYWIMAIIYFSLGGQDWRIDQNWLTGKSPCHADWYGVACSKNNEIEEIVLLSNNVVGSLPTEITNLTSIQILNLKAASLSGTLPTELGRMRILSDLTLEGLSLVGTLPTEIGLCENLQSLNLIEVELSGMIPTEIGSLSKLTLLGLPSKVEGMLPTELGLLSNLHDLYLVNMMYLRESLPSQLANLSRLSNLHILSSLHDEILFSSLLSSLPSTLESLFLDESNTIEQIPNELSLFDHLTSLVVVQSRLTGTLPSKLGLMTKLQSLIFTVTLLSGQIPSEIGNLTRLTELNLSCNKFSNVVPTELNKFSNLKSANFNQVCGK